MSRHTLPANYDAWKLSPPDDYAPRRMVSDHEFSRPGCLWDLNDTEADCEFSVSSGDTVTLETVTIAGKRFTADEIREWFGTPQVERLTEAAQDWWLEEGWVEAERDARDDWGDWKRDQLRDDN